MSSTKDKVLVAMSGGVDSAVAAGLLLESGYDVTGVFMCLGGAAGGAAAEGGASRTCCSPADSADAMRVAGTLGIPLFVLNLQDAFERIVDDFAREYQAGRTPNPCIHCNRLLKFGRLFQRADELGIQYVATGHHARAATYAGGPAIARGMARGKDQAYALFGIERRRLGRVLLPLGEVADKDEVRRRARELGLSVHDKPDSQEICFVPGDDYTAVLRERAPAALTPGDIVDATGKVLGRHDGYARYTIGQRRGLGVAAAEPMYVTKLDPSTATVTIGPRSATMRDTLRAARANWHHDLPMEFRATVQIRYNNAGAPGVVRRTGDDAFDVQFESPVSAITPGQAAVVFDGDTLLGGGWIE